MLDLLEALRWAIVATPDTAVHATSPDGRVYVGWLPEDTAASKRGVLWHVHVQPTEDNPWSQEFGPSVPSVAVAGFIAALVSHG